MPATGAGLFVERSGASVDDLSRENALAPELRFMGAYEFLLNPALDRDRLITAFRAAGRVQIPDFLEPECAVRLHRHLLEERSWKLIFNQGSRLYELDRAAQSLLSADQSKQLDLAVYKGARSGFQYRFENIRVPDSQEQRRSSGRMLDAFALFLQSDAVLALLTDISGAADITFADAQATAFGPGHFLTAHDDAVEGKNRRAAYVFGLTPDWIADWGGLLLFHGTGGGIEKALVPSFNTLNIFAVPQPHSVSTVAPFAPRRRYSVTGWLRAG